MDGQKYCENCGAVNVENDEFCTNCGNRFTSASTSPPPAPPPYTSPGSSGDQLGYAPSPKPQRRFKKRYVLYGVVVFFLLAFVASAFSGYSSQSASTSLNTPIPTIQAPTANVTTTPPTATAKPTATPTPQPGGPFPTQVTVAPSGGASVAQGQAITFTTTLYSVNEHKNVCGAVNYYIDGNPAYGTWNINPPGTCSASSGSLSLAGADTAKLSLGAHTLKIDWLGDSAYGPSQYVEQFTVTS
jgi:hypothetical protein